MSVRQSAALRRLARKLPVISAYERRIDELRTALEEQQAARPWVPPGHFYSPFPDLDEVAAREAELFWSDPLDVPGVDLRVAEQRALLDALEPLVAGTEWPRTEADARAAGTRYWAENPSYGDGDALFLTALLRHLRPRRLVELGSGFSSACTLDARDELGVDQLELVFVDPYPQQLEDLLLPGDRDTVTIIQARADQLDEAVLGRLGAGDVLFIDSTHVAKPGGDVNRNLFQILPAIAPGVVVHLHDIFPRFEYPKPWVEEGRGWNEAYVLRAFLQFNDAFEVLLWPSLLHALDPDDLVRRFPPMAKNVGGSIWLRRVS